ncbi:outer membrane protein transport protein [Dyella ginsengisoli]|uniref:Outer membrane protein transport protein n=1 Tax=Dyella ginsengisoli TaxID=363848 RepID=A0ABW8JV16_9GAMM
MLIARHIRLALTVAIAGTLLPGAGHAAAFQLKEKSAKAQGRAFAGSISASGDASVIADNPAAMRLLGGRVFQADLSGIDYSVRFHGSGADTLGRPLSGGNGGNAGATAAVPALYFHMPLGAQMHLGFSLTAPFGFKTEYDQSWVGRYHGIKTELNAVDFGASFSYDINPYFSLGGSVFTERVEARLNDAVDFGAILASSGVPGFTPGSADGHTRIDATDNALGYTVGALFTPTHDTRIGLAYRSEVNHKVNDVTVKFDVPQVPKTILAAARPGWFVNTTATTELKLPAMWTVSLTQQINGRWAVMADLSRTEWSAFKDIRLDFASAQPTQNLHFGYRDTTFGAIGTEYALSARLTLRAGVAYDQTPVTSRTRDVRVPDTNRRWLSVGATWKASPSLEYSVGYTHLFLDTPKVELTSVTGSSLNGSYDLSSDVIALALSYSF